MHTARRHHGLLSSATTCVAIQNSPTFQADLNGLSNVQCPDGHFQPGTSRLNGTCKHVSYPILYNDVFWQNRSYFIGVSSSLGGTRWTHC